MKAITAIVAAVALAAFAGTAGAAGFTDNFDSYADGAVPAPYVLDGPLQQVFNVQSGIGWGGSKGTNKAGSGAWGSATRATGLGAQAFVMTWKLYEDASDGGLTRLGGGLQTTQPHGGNPSFGWEDDDNTMWMGFSNGGPTGATSPIASDTWYEFRVTGAPATGTAWDVHVEERTWNGSVWSAWSDRIAAQSWDPGAPFVPAFAGFTMIGTSGESNQDDLSVVPEPATMALLGIGGLMVLRRRRAA